MANHHHTVLPVTNPNNGRRAQRRSQASVRPNANGRNMRTQFATLVDRSLQRSDEQVVNTQDAFEQVRSSTVPTSIPRSITQMIHWFQETCERTILVTSTTVPTFTAYSFSLSDLANASSLANLFDEYAIVAVTARLTCRSSLNSIQDVGLFCTAIDHDDDSSPSTLSAVQQYSSCIETHGGLGHTRVIYPRIATAAYNGAFTGYANSRAWIDIASPSVAHFGLKCAHSVTSVPLTYSAIFTYTYVTRTSR